MITFKGNLRIQRAIEVALAGNHSIGFVGVRGCGKTCFREAIAEISKIKTYETVYCRCGYYQSAKRPCTCTPSEIRRFQRLKKYRQCFDANIVVESIQPIEEALNSQNSWEVMKPKVMRTKDNFKIEESAQRLLKMARERLGINMVERCQIFSISSTIALLENSDTIKSYHMAEAIQYKGLPCKKPID